MIKRMLIMLVLVGAVLFGIFGFKSFVNGKIKEAMAAMGSQPQTVSTIKAEFSDWQSQLQAVGSLRAVRGADLSLEVAGVVEEIKFDSGQDVEAGQLLLRLRDEDDVAKLKSLEAVAELSQITYDRDLKQFKAQAVSQATVDTDAANLKNNKALAEQQKAIVDKKTLKAPFAGHLGLRQVDLGQYLAAGTAIVTLQALTPIYADFMVPQQALAQIKVGQEVSARTDTYPGKTFIGKVTAINPRVETATRNVQVRAEIENADRLLVPGMYVTVDTKIGQPQKLITLPQTAIMYNPYGNIVYVVDEKKSGDGAPQLSVHQTFVTLGATRGDQVSVLKGVEEGQTIVTSGQMKLRNGIPIAVNNTVEPRNDPNPKPVDE
ncbi:membrane fusion protein, multidrug efflux system [Enhydrobacter aerosaccus]|uniref:Membrane fusion protein, multidrug efflux system n=1 Tax=Enhydrobacter aerosaccus TaxID=225324 RepID=A0A1T4MP78_9HYPH|nr:efflux RND transporter periplasmic adaptor subunit [Enhydrobacter aerosaccus]SJZ68594.1 membrane fusion protein, multidrug efflux system [Enhydrobacter aerosaccus]